MAAQRPIPGEFAPSEIGGRLADWIGQLDPNPLSPTARYATEHEDGAPVLRLYRETLRDERVQAALDQRFDAVVSRPWEIRPGGDRPMDRRAAERAREEIGQIDIDSVCRELLYAVWFGFSVAEVVWAPRPYGVGIADLKVRAADRFRFAADGGLLLRTARTYLGEPVPDRKFVTVARPGEHGDLPHGIGLARWCYWPVWLRRNAYRYWSLALERFGSPIPIGYHSPNASQAEIDRLLEAMQQIRVSGALAVPEGTRLELLQSMARSGGNYQDMIDRLGTALTTTILGQSSTTDQGPWRGTAEVQQDVRNEVVTADSRMLDSALNRQVLTWWRDLNMPAAAAAPVFHRLVEPQEDLDSRAAREEIVSRTSGLRPTRRHVEEIYGGEWEEVPAAGRSPVLAHADEPAADVAIEAAGDRAVGDWQALMGPVIRPVLDAAAEAERSGESLETWRGNLSETADRMDTAPITQRLRRGMFSAGVSGRIADDEEAR